MMPCWAAMWFVRCKRRSDVASSSSPRDLLIRCHHFHHHCDRGRRCSSSSSSPTAATAPPPPPHCASNEGRLEAKQSLTYILINFVIGYMCSLTDTSSCRSSSSSSISCNGVKVHPRGWAEGGVGKTAGLVSCNDVSNVSHRFKAVGGTSNGPCP